MALEQQVDEGGMILDAEAVKADYEKAIEILEMLVEDMSKASYLGKLAEVCAGFAGFQQRTGDWETGRTWIDKAIELQRQACQMAPTNLELKKALDEFDGLRKKLD